MTEVLQTRFQGKGVAMTSRALGLQRLRLGLRASVSSSAWVICGPSLPGAQCGPTAESQQTGHGQD